MLCYELTKYTTTLFYTALFCKNRHGHTYVCVSAFQYLAKKWTADKSPKFVSILPKMLPKRHLSTAKDKQGKQNNTRKKAFSEEELLKRLCVSV